MTNHEIAKLLRNVAAAYLIKDERKFHFQIVAYQRAADTIEHVSEQVKDLVKEGKLHNLPGIGASIQASLKELVENGEVEHFEAVLKQVPEALFPLLDVPSFGPKKAFKLVNHFGLENPKTVIADIEKLAKQGKIASLPSFGEKSQSDIIRAISEFKEGKGKTTRMILPYAGEISEKILEYMRQSKAVVSVNTLGSLRRMSETVGDIDLSVSTDNPEEAITHFVNYPYKDRIIEQGKFSASILTSGGAQIDLLVQPVTGYGSLLQHFTGSKHHNVRLREFALKKGMSLSEKGIKKKIKGKEVLHEYDTEEKFYEAIGMQWVPPEMREDRGEVELAIQHKLPRLVELKDMRGDLHVHSSYPIQPSHDLGKNSMQDMIDRAKELGYEYIGFSEHNPSVSNHTKQQIHSIMARRQDKIEQLRESNKSIRIINLLELDILANGSLALDDKGLEYVDGALVSIHSSFATEKKQMTKRILNGLSHPKAKIFSHPTGRLLNERAGYEVDFDELFAFCIEHKKALEINGWPNRLDLPDIMVREAKDKGVKMTIDTDSHAVWQMDMMKYGVAVARRGWAEKKDILNTLPYKEFIQWLKS
jgi:DNA polymerase (family 10)